MAKKLQSDFKPQKKKLRLFVAELESADAPTIQLSGNREASVEGCKGVIDYYETIIKLRLSGGSVTFQGGGLEITSLTDNSAIIKGRIESVELGENISR